MVNVFEPNNTGSKLSVIHLPEPTPVVYLSISHGERVVTNINVDRTELVTAVLGEGAYMAAQIVLAVPGTVTDTDRKNAAVRLAERVLGIQK